MEARGKRSKITPKSTNGNSYQQNTNHHEEFRQQTPISSKNETTNFIPELLHALKSKQSGKMQNDQKAPIFKDGKDIAIRNWLFKFDLACSLNNISEENKVKLAANLTQDYALCVAKKYLSALVLADLISHLFL